jgi:hypothetical protein
MTSGEIIYKLEIEQFKDDKGTGYKLHINGSSFNKPNIKEYTVEEILVLLQTFGNLNQFYITKLNEILVSNNKANFAKN